MKRIVLAALVMTAMAVPVAGEVQTYEDEFVSFQYDDEVEGFIERYSFGDKANVMYSFESDGIYCNLNIHTDKDSMESIREVMRDSAIPGVVLEDTSDYILYLRGDKNGENSYYQMLADTAKTIEGFSIDPDGDYGLSIYCHYPYSEQALNYVRKAIEICNSYLDLSIDKKDAAGQIEDIEKRAKAYSESTEDAGDEDVASILFLKSSRFTFGDDAGVIELRDELQTVLDGAF